MMSFSKCNSNDDTSHIGVETGEVDLKDLSVEPQCDLNSADAKLRGESSLASAILRTRTPYTSLIWHCTAYLLIGGWHTSAAAELGSWSHAKTNSFSL